MEICFTVNGQVHCFLVPLITIDKDFKIHGPGPINFPELDLAATVLRLVEAIQPSVPDSAFTRQLTEVTQSFVKEVQAGLPQGVELRQARNG